MNRLLALILVVCVGGADYVTPHFVIVASCHAGPALGACIGLSKQFLRGVEANLESSCEVTFQVAGTVEIFALVKRHLLEDVVLACNPFFLLQEQVIGAGHLIMLVVLYKRRGLLKVVAREMIAQLLDELRDHRDAILANDDSLHFDRSDFGVPVVAANVSDRDSLGWVSVEDPLHEVLQIQREGGRYSVVARENLFVQLVRVGIFKRQISTSHRVEDNAAGPDIRSEAVVLLAGYHFRRGVARTATRRLEHTVVSVGI